MNSLNSFDNLIKRQLIILVIYLVKSGIPIEFNRPFQPHSESGFLNLSSSRLGEFHLMSTSKFNLPFSHTIGNWSSNKNFDDSSVTYVEVARRNPYKISKFLGFGCTFTDSDLKTFQRIPSALLDSIFKFYFSAGGLNFKLLRVSIDSNFEKKRKIYFKKLFQGSLNNNLKIVADIRTENIDSARNFDVNSSHSLKKFIDKNEIEILSLDFNASTVSNRINQIRKLIAKFNQTNTKFMTPIICLTDRTRRIEQPWLLRFEQRQNNILDKIDMISLTNHSVSPEFLCRAYKKYCKPCLFTKIEDVNQIRMAPFDSWQKAEELIQRIISLLHQNIVGYFGNSLISCTWEMHAGDDDALMILDQDGTELSKTPTFYAMAHFSRHILPASKRVAATICGPMASKIQVVTYLRPDAKILVLLHNRHGTPIPITVVDKRMGQFHIVLPKKSINSIIYCI